MNRLILVAIMLFGLVACKATDSAVARRQTSNFENYLQQQALYSGTEYNLGLKYDNGDGVPQDYPMAAYWFRRAAERGEVPAQVKLGLIYEKGLGVPQNNILAHMWLNLAALKGNEVAKSSRDSVAQRMTPAQIAEAERLAREWKGDADWHRASDYGL